VRPSWPGGTASGYALASDVIDTLRRFQPRY
jgi:hypothetical protein